MAYQIKGIAGENYSQLSAEEQAQVQVIGDATIQRYSTIWPNPTPQEQVSIQNAANEAAQRAAESIFTQKSNTLQAQNEQLSRDMNSFIAANPNAQSLPTNIDPTGQYMVKNGVLTAKTAAAEEAANEAAVAAGTMKKVPIGTGFGYIPVGSAADANIKNIGTNNTANAANAAATKPTGIDLIKSTLTPGSQGEEVKALQQYLQGLGFVGSDGKPLKVDGIYGPETKTAVMQFQTTNGVPSTGNFGPLSLAKAKTLTSTSTEAPLPGAAGTTNFNTGDPTQDALLKELQNFIKAQQDAGLKLNKDLQFDQATLDKFLETAKKQVHPYYSEKIDNIKADVLRAVPQVLQNYENDISKSGEQFQNNLDTAREDKANYGLAFSGQRGKQELSMQSAQDRTLQGLSQDYGNQLYKLGRTAEADVGATNASGYNLPDLAQYGKGSTSLSGNGSINSTGTSSPYTPGGFKIGNLQYDEQEAAKKKYQDLVQTAGNAVVNGRSYQDIFA